MWQQIDTNVIKELIRLSLNYRVQAGFGSKMTETAVQKTLYELKRNLPESNPIIEHLPYYWFKAGAFSEYVKQELESMTEQGILKREQNQKYSLFELDQKYANSRFLEHDENFQQARKKLAEIIKKQSFAIQNEIRLRYENDALSSFYLKFKLEFLPYLEAYYRSITRLEGKKISKTEREDLGRRLNVATSSLLFNSLFSGFKRSYFDFETSFYRIIQWDEKEKDIEFQEILESAVKLGMQIWDTFAYGSRIVKHDPVYEDRIENWKSIFNEKVDEMSSKTDEFYLQVLQTVKPKDHDEQIVSLEKLQKLILDYRKENEIAYINFQNTPKNTKVIESINPEIRSISEFTTFLNQGQIDWCIIKKLSDAELLDIIKTSIGPEPIIVAFSDNGTKIVTYRINSNSTYVAEQIPAVVNALKSEW